MSDIFGFLGKVLLEKTIKEGIESGKFGGQSKVSDASAQKLQDIQDAIETTEDEKALAEALAPSEQARAQILSCAGAKEITDDEKAKRMSAYLKDEPVPPLPPKDEPKLPPKHAYTPPTEEEIKAAPKGELPEDLKEVEQTLEEIKEAPKGELPEEQIPKGELPEEQIPKGELPEEEKTLDRTSFSELAKLATAEDRRLLLARLAAGLLGTLGTAGSFGPRAQPFTMQPLMEALKDTTSQSRADRIAKIAASYEDERRDVLDSQLARIEKLPIDEGEKQFKRNMALSQYNKEIAGMVRAIRPSGRSVSDEDMKHVKPSGYMVAKILRSDIELSDEDFKCFEEADPREVAKGFLRLGGPWRGHELQFLHDLVGDSEEPFKYKVEDCAIWSPETLLGYARWIRNSHYTYKPEAKKIDPNIDPDQEHIGPMAQEIEKVNPACVVETPEGVKTVDTSRLALMNSGAIGDLVRHSLMQDKAIQQLAEKVGM